MLEIHGKYQASFFADAVDIVPSAEIISALLAMFSDKELLPNTVQEIGVGSVALQPRIHLNSPNNEWSITFGSSQITIEKKPITILASNMGEVEDFVKDAVIFFARILVHFKLKVSRLAFATEGMFEQMDKELLFEIQKRLFRNIPFYEQSPSFEWNCRNVAKMHGLIINGQPEPLNVITSINRVAGRFHELSGALPFDRILVAFDINTEAENRDTRFSRDSLEEFLSNCVKLRAELLDQIEKVVHG